MLYGLYYIVNGLWADHTSRYAIFCGIFIGVTWPWWVIGVL